MTLVVEPVIYPEGGYDIPKLTLGWEVLAWCTENLTTPQGDRWIWTPEQARFVLQWYAIDEQGRWRWRRGVLRRMKGWGKDPLAAVLAVCEWIGPCRFGGWRGNGQPIAVREGASWVQVAAATAGQAEQNTMTLLSSIIPKRLEEREKLRIGIKAAWAPGRRRIQAVSNSSRGIEGARPSLCILNEVQHWVRANGGLQLAEVIQRNLAKSPGGRARSLAITNAHTAGEDSVAEHDWMARDAGDILYDSREAPPNLDYDDDEQVRAGIEAARGDALWIDVDRVLAEFRDPSTDPALNVRFFHNRVVAGSGRWMDPSTWSAADERGECPDGRMITLGFDGSRRRDATALVGTDLETGWQWIVGIWERDARDPAWEVPIDEVNAVVSGARVRWRVMRFYADPSWWEESVSGWAAAFSRKDGRSVVQAWYTGGGQVLRMARAVRAYEDAVADGACRHEPSKVFERHVLAAHVDALKGRAGEDGLRLLRKSSRGSTDSIDAAMAAVLSWQACLDARADGDLEMRDRKPVRVHLPPWMRG